MSRDQPPVLSVIIPVWNGERYLADAIGSVLSQTGMPSFEVIIVDDGSEDGSASVAAGFPAPVRCVRIPHSGLAAARNTGVEIARGEYLLHFDSDDILPPSSIAARVAAIHSPADGPPADIVVGRMISFVSPELDPDTAARFRLPSGPQRCGLGASMVRTSFAARVGELDTSRGYGADLDWMVRANELGARIVEIPAVVLHRRIHGGNMSLTPGLFERDRLAIIRAALNRRRPTPRGQDA